jgi:hypothetical protein
MVQGLRLLAGEREDLLHARACRMPWAPDFPSRPTPTCFSTGPRTVLEVEPNFWSTLTVDALAELDRPSRRCSVPT